MTWFRHLANRLLDWRAISGGARRRFSRSQARIKDPWAMLEVQAIEDDGRVKMAFDYNAAFLDKVKAMGFQAETDEDTVQLFFMASGLRPVALSGGDEAVQSSEHPGLAQPQNVLRM